jgi:methionyl-tRNA synthetase
LPKHRNILVTSALPYANGPIHLGHMVEYIQTDIWVRFQRLQGHRCLYVCASDAHGTPIMLRAQQDGVTPEALIESVGAGHQRDFSAFGISFDNYYTTHSAENEALTTQIYERLKQAGHISRATIQQAYDEQQGMFLPDRYVRGTCPNCGALDQYGDACENCNATYSPMDLKDAVSVVSETPPTVKDSEHLFFKLSSFQNFLDGWIDDHVDASMVGKLREWFKDGLKDWDISRDAPYFGFQIPGERDKYFYVWLDAPVGYMASTANLAARDSNVDFDEYWAADSEAELYHFIGKDIINFHALFWPAVLKGAGFRTPTGVFPHGFLTVDGQKMSKSRGTFIQAADYLAHLNPQCLRYYYAAKLSPGVDDIDLNLADFVARVNSDLVGKVVNIASRCAGFVHRLNNGRLADTLPDQALLNSLTGSGDQIAKYYESREFAKAMREIMALADKSNQYVEQHKPWILAKEDTEQAVAVCTQALNLYRVLMIYLKPVIPEIVAASEEFLNVAPLSWSDLDQPLLNHSINPYQPLLQRVETDAVNAMVTASMPTTEPPATPIAEGPAEINIDEFLAVDLRVAKIVDAQFVDGADKLLQLTLDMGNETRQVFSGIRSAYAPTDLVGRLTIAVANLKPRKMRFGVSEGMVLAASGDGPGIFLLSPDSGATPGMRVR